MKFDEMTDQERIIAYSRVLTSNDGENLKQMNLYDVGIFLRDLIVQQQEHNKQKELIDKIKIEIERQQNILKQQPSDNKDYDEYFNQHLSSISNLIKEYEDEKK